MATGDSVKPIWQSVKPMPTKRVYSSPAVYDGQLYIVGGCDSSGTPLDCFESYCLDRDRWYRLANMPTRRACPCVMAAGNKLVAMGGVSTTQQPVNVVEVYDPAEKEWSQQDVMKDSLMGMSGVVRDGKVIVVGGMGSDSNPKDYLMQYDADKDVWKSLASMPSARYATFSFLIHDKLYVLGGRQGKLPVAAFEVYDFQTSRWRRLPDIPSKRVFALYAHSDSHIFSVGGLQQDAQPTFSDVTEVFDLDTGYVTSELGDSYAIGLFVSIVNWLDGATETWTAAAPMLNKRADFAATFLSGHLVVAGGLGTGGKPLTDAEMFDPVANTWTSLPSMSVPVASCSFTVADERLYLIGGLTIGGPSASLQQLSLK